MVISDLSFYAEDTKVGVIQNLFYSYNGKQIAWQFLLREAFYSDILGLNANGVLSMLNEYKDTHNTVQSLHNHESYEALLEFVENE